MGCDIHIVVERKQPEVEWIGVWSSDIQACFGRPRAAQRNYGFFAEVAGVRGWTETSKSPRNLPRDVSRLAWVEYMDAPTDHHSVSHMPLDEFLEVWFRCHGESENVRREFGAYDLFGVDTELPEVAEYRVVFWFDN